MQNNEDDGQHRQRPGMGTVDDGQRKTERLRPMPTPRDNKDGDISTEREG